MSTFIVLGLSPSKSSSNCSSYSSISFLFCLIFTTSSLSSTSFNILSSSFSSAAFSWIDFLFLSSYYIWDSNSLLSKFWLEFDLLFANLFSSIEVSIFSWYSSSSLRKSSFDKIFILSSQSKSLNVTLSSPNYVFLSSSLLNNDLILKFPCLSIISSKSLFCNDFLSIFSSTVNFEMSL